MMPAVPSESRNFRPLRSTSSNRADGHQKIDERENKVAKVRVLVAQAGLNENRRVVADDGIDAGGLIAGENDAGEQKRNDIFAAQQRFLDLVAGGLGFSAATVSAISFNSISACASERERRSAARAASFCRAETASAAIRPP